MKRPRLIAEQARNATGLLGRLIAFIMSHETRGDNRRAIEALAIASGDHVLDIGCGHGRSLIELAARASKGKVVGADPSDVMIGMATRRAGELIAEGVLAIEMGANATDLKLSIHPHPTLTETMMESAEVFFGHATHVYRPKR